MGLGWPWQGSRSNRAGSRRSRRFRGCFRLALLITALDAAHIRNRFRIRRDAAVKLDLVWSRVVRGERQRQIIVVLLQQVAQVARTCVDVFCRVVDVFYAEL